MPDFDKLNMKRPLNVGEYAHVIYKDMLGMEGDFMLKNNYIENSHVTPQQRAEVINMIEEIHYKYRLFPETLFITIQTFDRWMAYAPEVPKDIQAVGIACLLLSSKYEDIYPPALDDMIKFTKPKTTRKRCIDLESTILYDLGFDFTTPTPLRFLERFSKANNTPQNTQTLAEYIIELTLHDFDVVFTLKPSEIAATALYIAEKTTRERYKWIPDIVNETGGLKEKDVKELGNKYFKDLPNRVSQEMGVKNVIRKYNQFKHIQFVIPE